MQGGLSQERTKQRLVTKSGRVRNRPRHHPEGQWGCSGPLDWKEPPRVEGATNHPAACLPVCPPPSSLIGLSAQPSFPARKLRKCSSPLSCSFRHTRTDPLLAGDELQEVQQSSNLLIALFRWPFLRSCTYWDGNVWNWRLKKQKLKGGSSTDWGALLWEPGSCGWPAQLPRASLPRRAHGWPALGGGLNGTQYVHAHCLSSGTVSAKTQDRERGGTGGFCSLTALTSILQSCPK